VALLIMLEIGAQSRHSDDLPPGAMRSPTGPATVVILGRNTPRDITSNREATSKMRHSPDDWLAYLMFRTD
jgi:hypothetical protein